MFIKPAMNFAKIFILVSLVNFFIAACLGLTMRYAFVWGSGSMNYKNIMYAHSHMALLGWIYLILSILLIKAFATDTNSKRFTLIFSFVEICILLVALSLFVTGYSHLSMVLLLLFILLSYIPLYKLWKNSSSKLDANILLLRTSIGCYIISTIGLLVMFLILFTRNFIDLYYIAIQFFLHFQMNGWLLFAALSLFFHQLKQLNIEYSEPLFKQFYYLLITSTLLTFALAVSWAKPNLFIFAVNSLGVILQLLALAIFFKMIRKGILKKFASSLDTFPKWMYGFAFISFVGKVVIQSIVFFPKIAVVSYTIRLYVLGFIHLITIGMITFFTLGYSFVSGYISYKNVLSRTGWIIVLAAFITTELLLFGQGTLVWFGYGYMSQYHEAIFISSILFPIGILLAFTGQFINTHNVTLNKINV